MTSKESHVKPRQFTAINDYAHQNAESNPMEHVLASKNEVAYIFLISAKNRLLAEKPCAFFGECSAFYNAIWKSLLLVVLLAFYRGFSYFVLAEKAGKQISPCTFPSFDGIL